MTGSEHCHGGDRDGNGTPATKNVHQKVTNGDGGEIEDGLVAVDELEHPSAHKDGKEMAEAARREGSPHEGDGISEDETEEEADL